MNEPANRFDEREFAGRLVCVSGGSSGIGAAVARQVAARGAHVAVLYNQSRSGAEATADAIRASGGSCQTLQADITQAADRQRLVRLITDRSQPLLGWVNMAGADVLTGGGENADFADKLDVLWQIDVRATILLARQLLPEIRAAAAADSVRPSILFVGWDQAFSGMEGDAGQLFCPIKAAVMAFTKSFAIEAAPEVRVNCVAPGWIRTAWGAGTSDYWDRRARGESLLDRWGEPQDVAAAVAWLLSADSDFINAQIININGGWQRAAKRRS